MEDPFENLSNDYRTLYYLVQLKVTDTAQTLRTLGNKLSENQIKTLTNQQLNIFGMTQKMFNQHGNTHLYHLLKVMNSNLSSIVVLLIQRVQKLTQKLAITQKLASQQCQNRNSKHEAEETIEKQCVFNQVRRNKLGGIQLFNENYSRYLEDHRILEQIKEEKDQRIHKKRNQLLSCMIYKELNHMTDVEGEPTPNDDIAKYIVQSRNKGSMYNYVPYQSELQQILTFFQNSQSEANNFLIKKGNDNVPQSNGKFSFADFQRDIQFRNRQFQRKVMEKLAKLIEKLKQREIQMQERQKQRQAYIKQLQTRKQQSGDKSIQTQFEFNQFIRQCENQRRDLQFKYEAFQNHKIEEFKYIQRENQLTNQLAYKQVQIQKMETQIQDLQTVIMNLKKMVREEKSRKHIFIKEQVTDKEQLGDMRQKSESKKEKESSVGSQVAIAVDELISHNSNNKLRKTSNKIANWMRKTSNDGTSLVSFSQSQPNERDQMSRSHGRKFVKYNIQNSKYTNYEEQPQLQKSKGSSFKFNRPTKSKQSAIQTEVKDQLDQYQNIQSQKTNIVINDEDQLKNSQAGTNKESKSSKIKFQSDTQQKRQTSLANLDKNQERVREKSGKKQNSSTPKKQVKQSKENLDLTQKNKSQSKQKQKSQKKSNRIKQPAATPSSSLQNLTLAKKKSNPKQSDSKQKNEEPKQARAQTELIQLKDQNLYSMFQVVEQEGEQQKQSIRNTKRGSLIESIQSPMKKIDYESVEKITKQLRKAKIQKNYFSQQIYSFSIKPGKQFQKMISLTPFQKETKNPLSCQKNEYKKKLRNSTQTSQALVVQTEKSMSHILQSFEKMQKINKGGDRNSLQKLKNLKKKIESIYKSNLLNRIDIQNIANILHISHNSYGSVIENKIYTPKMNSVDPTHRSSLIQRVQQQNLAERDDDEQFQKYCSFRHNSLSDQFHHSITKGIQNELKLQQIITFQALNDDFSTKFQKLHKSCQEGGICSHVTKYFEVIMKHFEEVRQKQKHLLSLHVENIGNKVTVSQNEQPKKKQKTQQSTLLQSRENTLIKIREIDTRYQGKSLQKLKKSKLVTLPHIKDSRNSLYQSCK